MPRRFQFSLKVLLVGLTTGCVCLGWFVERARRRGQAIDALVERECDICYLDNSIGPLSELHRPNHFWADLKRVPVQIGLGDNAWSEDETVYAAITAHLSRIYGIEAVTQPRGLLIPPPDVRKWRSTLSRILPDSVLDDLVTSDYAIEMNASAPQTSSRIGGVRSLVYGSY